MENKLFKETKKIIDSAKSHTDEQLVLSELNLIQEKLNDILDYVNDLENFKRITETKWNRKYANRYLEEQREKWVKENPVKAKKGYSLMYPDSESIFKDYYLLRDIIDKAVEYIKDYKHEYYYDLVDKKEILDILKGKNKDNLTILIDTLLEQFKVYYLMETSDGKYSIYLKESRLDTFNGKSYDIIITERRYGKDGESKDI